MGDSLPYPRLWGHRLRGISGRGPKTEFADYSEGAEGLFDSGFIVRGLLYLGRVHHYLLYDGYTECPVEKMDLLPVFLYWLFL